MLINTRGIALNMLRYSDSSVIAKIYTEHTGLKSFLVRTGKGAKALQKTTLLQPLSLVEVSFNNDERKSLRTIRGLEREKMLTNIPFDTVKTCLALFISEVIGRSITEEEENNNLFNFLHTSILLLDRETHSIANFHLKFMLEFSRYLGFYPQKREPNCSYFDLTEGTYTPFEPLHPYVLHNELTELLELLTNTPYKLHFEVSCSNENRRILLQKLVDYYRLHLDGMKEITSHKVLEQVLA